MRCSTTYELRCASAMRDFDDRDLVRLAEEAGFARIHLECHIDIEPGSLTGPIDLDAFLASSPNPLAPTVREAMAEALTPAEEDCFSAHLERTIASGDCVRRTAVAYLTATKRG